MKLDGVEDRRPGSSGLGEEGVVDKLLEEELGRDHDGHQSAVVLDIATGFAGRVRRGQILS